MMKGEDRAATFNRPLRTIFDVGAVAGLTDGELLERFAGRRGESAELAFAALLERHGPMVYRVCRKVLGDRHDALDAFQATFLVLVRKAPSIRKADSIASWLHGVAYRVALCDRSAEARRRKHERRASETVGTPRVPGPLDDLGQLLHLELDRLPERYRAPLVLCHLEGLTHEQAAERLGWPVGTVKSRMARGRDRLKSRLAARGLEPSRALGWAGIAIPPSITMDATARAATRLAAGQPIAGTVPASAVALMQGVLKTMTLKKLKLSIAALLAAGLVAAAAGVLAQQPEPRPAPAPVPVSGPAPGKGIAYETSFVEMTGLAWRGEFHKRLRPVARQGPYTVWAVDQATLKEILGRGKVVAAPKVTAFADARASIRSESQTRILAGFQDGPETADPQPIGDRPAIRVVGRVRQGDLQADSMVLGISRDLTITATDVTIRNDPSIPKSAKGLDIQRIPDGVHVQMSGHRVDNGVLVRAELESDRIVSMAGYEVPETIARDGAVIQGNIMVQVPEVIHSRFEGEWVVPDDGALLVGLGIHGVHKPGSPDDYSERLVAFKAGEIDFPTPRADAR